MILNINIKFISNFDMHRNTIRFIKGEFYGK